MKKTLKKYVSQVFGDTTNFSFLDECQADISVTYVLIADRWNKQIKLFQFMKLRNASLHSPHIQTIV